MNSTFKVVFNKARGALMVVNEATSSVQAKGTKTVIAAAVTALMAGGAMAALPSDGVITNENLKEVGTTKLTSGMGQTVTIQTNGNVSQLIEDLRKLFKNPCSQAELNKIVPFGFSLQRQKMVFFCHQNSIILLC